MIVWLSWLAGALFGGLGWLLISAYRWDGPYWLSDWFEDTKAKSLAVADELSRRSAGDKALDPEGR